MSVARTDQGLLEAALEPVARRRRRIVRPRRQQEPRGPLLFLFRALRQIVAEVTEGIEAAVFPLLEREAVEEPRLLPLRDPDPVTDQPRLAGGGDPGSPLRADQRNIFGVVGSELDRSLAGLDVSFGSAAFRARARELARIWGGRVLTQNRREVLRQVRQVLGVEFAGGDAAVLAQVEAFVEDATDLIVTIPRQLIDDVKATVLEAAPRGLRVEGLQALIQERFGVGRSRAALIARDQTLKLAGRITKTRQTAVGIRAYIWSTSKDERVRPLHRELEGTRQEWDSPPVVSADGRREHPGGDFQ